MRHNYICYTKFPNINDLLCLFATINNFENNATCLFNSVILKCRQLIFENKNVIALPQTDNLYGIYIIVKEDYYVSGDLNKFLADLDLKGGAPTVVQKYIYEACCMYTITAKLAPKWNQVNNYFIRGRNFLIESSTKDCLRLNLCINDTGNTSMIFEISRVRLPIMTLDQLSLTENQLHMLTTNRKINFQYFNGHTNTIRVLPSLKKGNILSLSLSINELFAMKNYPELRRHWKNTYGYRLPEEDRGIFYMEVSFFEGSQIFTYPSICVRPFEPTFLQRINPAPVVADFMIDLQKEMPTILGERYPIPSYVGSPNLGIISTSQSSMYLHPSQATITKEDQKISDTQTSAVIYLPTQKNATQSSQKSEDDSKSKLSQLLAELNKVEKRNVVHFTTNINENKMENCNKSNVQNINIPENNLEILQKTPQFTPRFKFIKKNENQIPNTINSVKKIGLAIPKNNILRKKQQRIIVISQTSETDIKESVKKKKMEDNLSEFSPSKNIQLKNEASVINNMKELVQNGEIHKLNNQSLFNWLTRRSVHCTTKEKKSDLVQKVVNIINNSL